MHIYTYVFVYSFDHVHVHVVHAYSQPDIWQISIKFPVRQALCVRFLKSTL